MDEETITPASGEVASGEVVPEVASAPAVNGVVLQPGQRVLSSGAVIDTTTGKMVGNVGGPSQISSSAQASALARLRWEKAQRAALSGLGRASLSNKGSALAAWADINANMAGYAMTERSIGAVKAAEFVGKATGFAPDKAQTAQTMPDNGIVMMISDGALELAAGILAAMRADNAQHSTDEE